MNNTLRVIESCFDAKAINKQRRVDRRKSAEKAKRARIARIMGNV